MITVVCYLPLSNLIQPLMPWYNPFGDTFQFQIIIFHPYYLWQQCWWQFCRILNVNTNNIISLSCLEWKLLSLIFSLKRSSGSRAAAGLQGCQLPRLRRLPEEKLRYSSLLPSSETFYFYNDLLNFTETKKHKLFSGNWRTEDVFC